MANISLQIESKFAEQIYRCYERMMQGIMDGLNLKYSWRFAMFGNIAEDEKTFENARQGMTLGILPQTMLYMAMLDMSVMDDMAISRSTSLPRASSRLISLVAPVYLLGELARHEPRRETGIGRDAGDRGAGSVRGRGRLRE